MMRRPPDGESICPSNKSVHRWLLLRLSHQSCTARCFEVPPPNQVYVAARIAHADPPTRNGRRRYCQFAVTPPRVASVAKGRCRVWRVAVSGSRCEHLSRGGAPGCRWTLALRRTRSLITRRGRARERRRMAMGRQREDRRNRASSAAR